MVESTVGVDNGPDGHVARVLFEEQGLVAARGPVVPGSLAERLTRSALGNYRERARGVGEGVSVHGSLVVRGDEIVAAGGQDHQWDVPGRGY